MLFDSLFLSRHFDVIVQRHQQITNLTRYNETVHTLSLKIEVFHHTSGLIALLPSGTTKIFFMCVSSRSF